MKFLAACLVSMTLFLCMAAKASTRTVMAHMDIPVAGSTVPQGAFYVAGWALDCDTGQIPTYMTIGLWNLDGGGWWFPTDGGEVRGVYRPDVQAAFGGLCPGLSAYDGFHLYTNWPPPGHWRIYMAWAATDGTRWDENMDIYIN